MKAISISTHDYKNVFTFVKINQLLLAIDKENHHYILLNKNLINVHETPSHSHADRISSCII